MTSPELNSLDKIDFMAEKGGLCYCGGDDGNLKHSAPWFPACLA